MQRKYLAQIYKVLRNGKGQILMDADSPKHCAEKVRAAIDNGSISFKQSDDCTYVIFPIDLDGRVSIAEIESLLGIMKYNDRVGSSKPLHSLPREKSSKNEKEGGTS